MANRVGGQVPDSYGLSLTVTCPTASETNPIETDDILTFATTGPYHAVPAAAGAAVQMIAKEPIKDPFTGIGVWVFGFSRVQKMRYTGAAPVIGGSIEADGTGKVRAATTANGSYVLFVDTARSYVEVALP